MSISNSFLFFSPQQSKIIDAQCLCSRDPFARCHPWLPCARSLRRRPRRCLSVLLLLTLGAGSAPPPSTAAASLAALRHCSLCTRTFRLGLQRLPGVLRRPRPLGEPGLPRRALPQHVLSSPPAHQGVRTCVPARQHLARPLERRSRTHPASHLHRRMMEVGPAEEFGNVVNHQCRHQEDGGNGSTMVSV